MTALPEQTVESLLAAARVASRSAYAPYSKISVGAALLVEDGSTVTGTNVENSSFGLTICAERSAVAAAVSQGHSRICAIAITSPQIIGISPCGACRQVLAEFGDSDMEVILDCGEGRRPVHYTLGELLPVSFSMK